MVSKSSNILEFKKMTRIIFLSAILLFSIGSKTNMSNKEIDIKEIRKEIIRFLPQETDIDTDKDICSHLQDNEDSSYSCFLSKKSSSDVFQTILNYLNNKRYETKSAIRQDYGVWSVILKKDGASVVLRVASLDGATKDVKQYYEWKQMGFRSKTNISVSKEKKRGDNQ